ncbi:uncharacterized protein FFB20_00289 [Fusarium fujikuroi]|nr:uncharacterized protein FFB20_00289 [Fusarium fujikuroi]SCN77347.1 uncharacterized protein FFC1_02633 [Fusarium fujikuroi]SCN86841.1 uncharacterized protein FFE2_06075 [Fusarium fujikuroi]SCN93012.1 uncharacterized protein FFM5_05522 [Fusarium fujikuroi]SCO31401.1 uncharacterized protein FFNC_02093 [Fusarium fujikuroi]
MRTLAAPGDTVAVSFLLLAIPLDKVAQIASSVVQGWRNDCLVACDAGALCHRHYAYQTLPRRLSAAFAIQRFCG